MSAIAAGRGQIYVSPWLSLTSDTFPHRFMFFMCRMLGRLKTIILRLLCKSNESR